MDRTGPALTARRAGLVGCTHCTKVHSIEEDYCDRCGAALESRSPTSLQRVWAWWIAGVIAYIPANTNPMLITRTLLSEDRSTIMGGVIELFSHHDYFVALVVFVASILIPVLKFVAIAYLAISVQRRTRLDAHQRHKLYEVVEFIGRWSMIDVFVVAILSSLVQLNVIVSITPGPASLTFALSVIFTMLAAQSFDSRMIWDAQAEADAA